MLSSACGGETAPYAIEVPRDALWCSSAYLDQPLDEAAKRKAQARVAAGLYEFDNEGIAPPLPVEARFGGGEFQALWDAGFRSDLAANTAIADEDAPGYERLLVFQPLLPVEGQWGSDEVEFFLEMERKTSEGQPFQLTAEGSDDNGLSVSFSRAMARWSFSSCDVAGTDDGRRVEVDFDGGSLSFEVRFAHWPVPGTAAAQAISAEGELDGQSFSQADWFRLNYVDEMFGHNAFSFGVLFDTPISDACGLAVRHINYTGLDPREETVHLIDCDYLNLEARPLIDWRIQSLDGDSDTAGTGG